MKKTKYVVTGRVKNHLGPESTWTVKSKTYAHAWVKGARPGYIIVNLEAKD